MRAQLPAVVFYLCLVALVAAARAADDALVEPTQYLEESLTHEDPEQQARIEELVDQAVTARLAGIPRPRYIPATDIAPPKGLLLHATDPRRGEFPFAMALGGYMQLRWLEFARDATQWTDSAAKSRKSRVAETCRRARPG